jgi:cell wall-associated NlpC family hydrolase
VAIDIARRVRPLIALAALGGALTVAPALADAAAPHAQPSVASVQKQLGELALKNSQLVEKYNQAQVVVQRQQVVARKAQLVANKANAIYNKAHAQFAQVAQLEYESGSLGAAGALLDSSSDHNYIERLETLNMISAHNAQVVEQVSGAHVAATKAQKHATALLNAARSQRDALARKKSAVEAQIRKYQDLLATLNSAQQYAYEQAFNPALTANKVSALHVTAAPTKAAKIAVQFALDQVGKPYVFGAAGPSSYDCSGLTMQAWAHAGVSLPHSAADQFNYGHHVSRSELEPGDLIFFYQPIGHVTIYIGGGLMVSAPTEGENVSVVPLSAFNGSYTGATRLTG